MTGMAQVGLSARNWGARLGPNTGTPLSPSLPPPVPTQPTLRPFDVAVALRLALVPEERYEPLASAMATSTSAVHRSVGRLRQARVCRPGSRTVHGDALLEFLRHGVRYAFPAVIGGDRQGVPTAGGHLALAAIAGEDTAVRLVWPLDGGTANGRSLIPLFTAVTRVAERDARVHALLAATDLLRVGSPAQCDRALAWLAAQLTGVA